MGIKDWFFSVTSIGKEPAVGWTRHVDAKGKPTRYEFRCPRCGVVYQGIAGYPMRIKCAHGPLETFTMIQLRAMKMREQSDTQRRSFILADNDDCGAVFTGGCALDERPKSSPLREGTGWVTLKQPHR